MNNYTVYMHISPSGKKYIGITCRKPEKRWSNGQNYKHNKYFFDAIKKYGWNNIEHLILFQGLTEDEALKKEKELIAEHKSNQREYGYNISLGGDFSTKGLHCNLGKKRTLEQREKQSKKLKGLFVGEKNPMYGKSGALNPNFGRKATEEERMAISKPVYQFDLQGNLINKWFGVREAEYKTGLSSASICHCCNKRKNHKTCGGFIWSYEPNIETRDYIDNKKIKIQQINKNGEVVKIWESASSIGKEFNITKASVRKWVSNDKLYRGFYWRDLIE